MKNKIVKILLSVMMVSLSVPISTVYGANSENLYAGVTKEISELIKHDIYRIEESNQYDVYTTANVNVRMYPDIKSEILDIIPFNSNISVFDYNDEWAAIYWDFYNDENNLHYKSFAYINKKYISIEGCKYAEYMVPQNRGFKSFMPYTSITDTTSAQYDLQKCFAYTDGFGIRKVNNRYCVAVGTAFNVRVGTYFDLILENEVIVPCISADIKSSEDTLSDNVTTAENGCVSEFIVDINSLYKKAKQNGDISACYQEWDSPVKMIKVYEKNIYK